MEQTFIMIKPDGVQRGLIGEIIRRFENKGCSLKGLQILTVERSVAEKHYEDACEKPYFSGLIDYIISGPVVAMIWEGQNVVATGRNIIGSVSTPGTIRGDYAIETRRNIIHGSDTVESARKEIGLWFPEGPANWGSSLTPGSMNKPTVSLNRQSLIHGSDVVESARKKFGPWLPEGPANWGSSLTPGSMNKPSVSLNRQSLIHGSDVVESARKEIRRWFPANWGSSLTPVSMKKRSRVQGKKLNRFPYAVESTGKEIELVPL